jgi:hypothetical protein
VASSPEIRKPVEFGEADVTRAVESLRNLLEILKKLPSREEEPGVAMTVGVRGYEPDI